MRCLASRDADVSPKTSMSCCTVVSATAVEVQQSVEVAGRSRGGRLLDSRNVLVLRPRCVELAEDVLHRRAAAVGCRLGVG